jgi:hypothetical protein
MPNGNIFPTNYLQMLKAIVVVYGIQLKPACLIYGNCLEAVFESFQVEAVTTAVINSFHRRIADGKLIVGDFVSSSKVAVTWCRVF